MGLTRIKPNESRPTHVYRRLQTLLYPRTFEDDLGFLMCGSLHLLCNLFGLIVLARFDEVDPGQHLLGELQPVIVQIDN